MTDTLASPTPSAPLGSPVLPQRAVDGFNPQQIARLEIFPPIGIARVGDSGATDVGEPDPNSQVEYFYGPEVPGVTDTPASAFRDSQGKIKRQAVRFRVYAYDEAGNVLGEVNNAGGYTLNWTVHVANKKAAFHLYSGRFQARKKYLRNPDVDSVDVQPSEEPLDPFDTSLEGRKKLIVDPGPQSIARYLERDPVPVPLVGKFQGSLPNASDAVNVTLGELRTDDVGRLVFIGGSGVARSVQGTGATTKLVQPEIVTNFDNFDWIDSICDGWVDVQVGHAGRPDLALEITNPRKATVLSAPPKFAWGIEHPITLYDILEDIYNTKMSYDEHSGTDFYKDIWPVLVSTYRFAWVSEKAFQGHGPRGYGDFLPKEDELSTPNGHPAERQQIFGRLRQPNYSNKDHAHVILMPPISGDGGNMIQPGMTGQVKDPIKRFSALTGLQYNRFEDWKDGKFITGTPYATKQFIEDYDKAEQPVLLTRAMLEQSIGDPLYPGIETYWIAKLEETYDFSDDLKGLHPPFRIDHTRVLPGFLSRGLSLPWQSDFSLCDATWWPSARPFDVFVLPGTASLGGGLDIADFLSPATPDMPPNMTAPNAPRLKDWTRGLRDTVGVTSAAFLPKCTDMVKFWTGLGFVVKKMVQVREKPAAGRSDEGQTPVWIEQERQPINGFQ